jgi:hypothetical protein
LPVRVRRSEIRVTAAATPSSSTIRPRIWAPNSELPRASGMVDESATGCCLLFGSAGLPGAGLGTAEGLICGKRLEALPAGIVVEMPGTVTSGTVPSGRLEPRLEPRLETVPPTPAVVPADEDPEDGLELFVPEPEEACVLVGLAEGLGLAARVNVTVTASLAGAVFGIVSSASACAVAGCLVGSDETAQLEVLPQPTVKVGLAKAGVESLVFTVAVMVPCSLLAEAQADIRKRIVSPGSAV